jgi:hypothetical protein
MHKSAPYDPVKAHEYYIRTRQLKGRKKGQTVAPKSTTAKPKSSMFTVGEGKTAVRLTEKQLAEQMAAIETRINSIKKSLAKLGAKLKEAMAEAEAKKAKSRKDANKKPTAAEKSKAARESKQYREKHQQEIATKSKGKKESSSSSSTKDPVAELEDKIFQVKGRLDAAVAKAKALASATRT